MLKDAGELGIQYWLAFSLEASRFFDGEGKTNTGGCRMREMSIARLTKIRKKNWKKCKSTAIDIVALWNNTRLLQVISALPFRDELLDMS